MSLFVSILFSVLLVLLGPMLIGAMFWLEIRDIRRSGAEERRRIHARGEEECRDIHERSERERESIRKLYHHGIFY